MLLFDLVLLFCTFYRCCCLILCCFFCTFYRCCCLIKLERETFQQQPGFALPLIISIWNPRPSKDRIKQQKSKIIKKITNNIAEALGINRVAQIFSSQMGLTIFKSIIGLCVHIENLEYVGHVEDHGADTSPLGEKVKHLCLRNLKVEVSSLFFHSGSN